MNWYANQRGSQRKLGRTRGVLMILSTFLVTSAVIRVGNGAGQALALASVDSEPNVSPAVSTCQTPDDVKLLLEAVQKREGTLKERETSQRDRQHALDLADQEIRRKMVDLKLAENELRQLIMMSESSAENDLSQLTKVYESMKPKQAAALFEELDPVFAAGFLARMRPEAAADILAGLTPPAAHGISVILAGRNANAPRE